MGASRAVACTLHGPSDAEAFMIFVLVRGEGITTWWDPSNSAAHGWTGWLFSGVPQPELRIAEGPGVRDSRSRARRRRWLSPLDPRRGFWVGERGVLRAAPAAPTERGSTLCRRPRSSMEGHFHSRDLVGSRSEANHPTGGARGSRRVAERGRRSMGGPGGTRYQRVSRFEARDHEVATQGRPCGLLGHPRRGCRCAPSQIRRYQGRLSGPPLDRIDLSIHVPAVSPREVTAASCCSVESSLEVRARVTAASPVQRARFSDLPSLHAKSPCMILQCHVSRSRAARAGS
ncbi:MAG: ATP-binding protein [Candidatus Eisenbacteria bacterium]|nr:ATP-binding protein [Candidatus Eisenbacteria bacterium]